MVQKRYIFIQKGDGNGVSQGIKELLRYMEDTKEENVCSEDLKEIHEIVKTVKQDKGVIIEHMKSFERDELLREEAREEERMKSFEREQQLREEVREEERKKSLEREQELLDRIKKIEEELNRLREKQ